LGFSVNADGVQEAFVLENGQLSGLGFPPEKEMVMAASLVMVDRGSGT
jgi:hypothetical protein